MEDLDLANRHPGVLHLLEQFESDHLPAPQRAISVQCRSLARAMVHELPDGPELVFGLRQLLLAKDAFFRCAEAKAKADK